MLGANHAWTLRELAMGHRALLSMSDDVPRVLHDIAMGLA
jgi:hypothetical protein